MNYKLKYEQLKESYEKLEGIAGDAMDMAKDLHATNQLLMIEIEEMVRDFKAYVHGNYTELERIELLH